TKEEVTKAFKNLTNVDKNLAHSAEARQVIDLAWGAVLTRFISLASQQTGKDFLSVGRVQSPTLALIVNRELEIQSFKPTPYWEVVAELEKGIKFPARHATEKFLKIEDAKKALENAKKADKGIVTDSKISTKHEKPPSPFNTTMFLAAAGTIGLSPAQAMNIAEELYTNGYISYPRTDNTVYPPSEDLKGILNKLLSTEFANDVKEILAKGPLHPTSGKKSTTDHPPIHPTDAADRKKLSENEWKVYELIVRRFLATLGEDMVSEVISLKFDLNGEPFVSRGLRIIDKGWRKYYPYGYIKETELPKLKVGENAKVISVELVSKMTQPPKRYSQGGLIQEMERLGLGTKSTRHEIIQKLYARNYIQGVPPQPTKPGIAVTQALEKHAEKITKPDMTAMLEKDMDKIAEGEKDLESTVEESKEMLMQIVEVMEANRAAIGKVIKDALKSQNVIGKCPDCNGNLGILRSQKGKRFVGCSNFPKCKRSYPLPQNGKIIYTGENCSDCGAPQIKLITKGKRPWLMCLNMTCPSKNKASINAKNKSENNKTVEKNMEEIESKESSSAVFDE
ncbi:MAG: DNA topoisomerase I, partial [Thermoplasmata archaeon]